MVHQHPNHPDFFDHYIVLRGLRFHYRKWHCLQQNTPTLILLHGLTNHSHCWNVFAQRMSTHYPILALDLRGHGESAWDPDALYNTAEMVSDLAAMVLTLKLKRFALLGGSLGGIVAYQYASQKPSSLTRLIVVDMAPEVDPDGLAMIRHAMLKQPIYKTAEDIFQYERSLNPVPDESIQRAQVNHGIMQLESGKWVYRMDPAVLLAFEQNTLFPKSDIQLKMLKSISVPTLLLRGENSILVTPKEAKQFVETIQNGTWIDIQGAGHTIPLDKPDEFYTAVKNFLAPVLNHDSKAAR